MAGVAIAAKIVVGGSTVVAAEAEARGLEVVAGSGAFCGFGVAAAGGGCVCLPSSTHVSGWHVTYFAARANQPRQASSSAESAAARRAGANKIAHTARRSCVSQRPGVKANEVRRCSCTGGVSALCLEVVPSVSVARVLGARAAARGPAADGARFVVGCVLIELAARRGGRSRPRRRPTGSSPPNGGSEELTAGPAAAGRRGFWRWWGR